MHTMRDKLNAVERELLFRKRLYPTWIEQGRMTEEFAATQIAIFAEIADDYRNLAADEELPLFPPSTPAAK